MTDWPSPCTGREAVLCKAKYADKDRTQQAHTKNTKIQYVAHTMCFYGHINVKGLGSDVRTQEMLRFKDGWRVRVGGGGWCMWSTLLPSNPLHVVSLVYIQRAMRCELPLLVSVIAIVSTPGWCVILLYQGVYSSTCRSTSKIVWSSMIDTSWLLRHMYFELSRFDKCPASGVQTNVAYSSTSRSMCKNITS